MTTKSDTVGEISRLLEALADKFDGDVDEERDFLAEHCPRRLERTIREIPTAAIHLLAALGPDEMNIVGLAARTGQLKGTVSKNIQRLVDAGLVERTPVPGNRKEVRLGLTADGRVLQRWHERMHDEIQDGLREFFLRYTTAQLDTVVVVLRDLLRTEKRGVRLFTAAGR